MRNALRIVAALAALTCSVLSLTASSQPVPLSLVSTAWPPFTNPPGQPRFALDLVEAALGRVQINAKTTIVSAAQFTPSLLSGQYDGSAAVWKDAARERALVYSQPYLENRLVLVGRHGADVSATALTALKGKRVAIVEGYSYGDTIDAAGPVWVRTHGEEDSLAQLLKSGVDYTLMDELVVHYIVSNYPKESGTRLQIGTAPLVTRELYLAISRTRADAESLISRFNAQLRGMIADRTYHRLLHVDWIRADVNGDGVPEYVPASDRPGPTAPQRSYDLFTGSGSARTEKPASATGFYVGGNIYRDWTSVPDVYKTVVPNHPDPRRSTASIFKFSW
jgi:polar amino acid transport system substrate-binding protein